MVDKVSFARRAAVARSLAMLGNIGGAVGGAGRDGGSLGKAASTAAVAQAAARAAAAREQAARAAARAAEARAAVAKAEAKAAAIATDQLDARLLPLLDSIKSLALPPTMLRALASHLEQMASLGADLGSGASDASDAAAMPPQLPVPPRARAVITRWICEGYGFAVHEGRTIFLHEDEFDDSVPKRAGRSTALPPGEGPKAGDHVAFDVATNERGFFGRNIQIVLVADMVECTQELVERKPRGKPTRVEHTGSSSNALALTLVEVEGMAKPGREATLRKEQRSSNDKRRAYERARKEQGKHPVLPGDWHCPKCNFLVFASSDGCPKCARAKA